MMRIKIMLILSMLSVTVLADPFDKHKREKGQPQTPLCHQAISVVFAQHPLNALRLVGVLQQNTVWQAFFVNDNAQIETVTVGQFVSSDALKVQQIDQFGVQLSYWKNKQTCTDEGIISLKF
ncbi:pilus assembly protein PilP [Bisgaard Taxon 45]